VSRGPAADRPDDMVRTIKAGIAIVLQNAFILNKNVVKKSKGKVISTETTEVGRYDHVYVSTAAFGGTIFWKNNQEYMTVTRAKGHK
jgi:hypothetical protein